MALCPFDHAGCEDPECTCSCHAKSVSLQIQVKPDLSGLEWKEWAAAESTASEDADGIFRLTPKGYLLIAELLEQASTDSSLGGDRSRHTTKLFTQTAELVGELARIMIDMMVSQREVERPRDGQRRA